MSIFDKCQALTFMQKSVDLIGEAVYKELKHDDTEEAQVNNPDEDLPLLHLLPILQRIISLTGVNKKFGLTKSQTIIFIVLHYRGSMTMSEAAQYISSSKEQATRAVAVICEQGLVERFENPDNRIHVYIRFTEKGEEYMRQLLKQLHTDVSEKLRSSLTEKELSALRTSVQTTVDILNKVK